MSLLRMFVRWQLKMSRSLDKALFNRMSMDGNGYYLAKVVRLIPAGAWVADVGGGKRPFFDVEETCKRGLRVTGVDIDAQELAMAPRGAYAEVIVSPLEQVFGPATNDFVIAQSVLEHVSNGREAIRGCASLLRPGGQLFTFCPNRRACFAVLNRCLPEKLKRVVLFGIFPEKREKQGFPAFYDGCTPEEMLANMRSAGLEVLRVDYFFVSSYFMFFFPLYLSWRLIYWPLMRWKPEKFCETFMITAVKRESFVAGTSPP